MTRLFAILCFFIAAIPALADKPYDFYSHGGYRKSVPRPSAILGYEIGSTHTTFRDQERVIRAIAEAAKDRVRVVDYGVSVEGRPLRLVLVSSPENIARLEDIRGKIARLADPRGAQNAELERILKQSPCITWINHCIHGSETASFEACMMTLYTLAASESDAVQRALRNTVVVLNPVFNPDGHERYVTYYNSVAVGSPDRLALEKDPPWEVQGRFNHYRFDMNRDKLALSQPESRQETAALQRWNPQVYVDQHGETRSYFFPPNDPAVHAQADRTRLLRWTTIFGQGNADAFDKYGWQYSTRGNGFDFFYPGYLDTYAGLMGAIGMTYETDGGGVLAERHDDGTSRTMRQGVAHHFEAALATVRTAGANRENLLRDFLAYKHAGIAGDPAEKIKQVVIAPSGDPGRLAELAEVLIRLGVEVKETTSALKLPAGIEYLPPSATASKSKVEAKAGLLVVDLAQPNGKLARAILEPDPGFEPEFVKDQAERRARNELKNPRVRKEEYSFYDVSAWSLPYAYGLTAYSVETPARPAMQALKLGADGRVALTTLRGGVPGGKAKTAYLIPWGTDGATRLAVALLEEGFRLVAAHEAITAGGKEWPKGTLVALVERNPETLHSRIDVLAKANNVEVVSLATSYSAAAPRGINSPDAMQSLRVPRIAVAAGDNIEHTSFGSVWHFLERELGVKFTPVRLSSIGSADLSRFNVLIIPDGYGIGGVLGKAEKLKEWVGRGNALIGLGAGGTWFAGKEAGISSAVRVGGEEGDDDKPDAKPTEEKPETKPTEAKPEAKPGEAKSDEKAPAAEKKKATKPLPLPGTIFLAKLDPTHFLAYGYGGSEIAVPVAGSTFLKPSTKGANAVTFGKALLRLSGWAWPDNTEELLAETAYVIDEPLGRGHAILFLHDPTFRSLWPGLRRMLVNAILFGPSRSATFTEGEEGR